MSNKPTKKKQKINWKKILLVVVCVTIISVTAGAGYFAWTIYQNIEDFDVKKLVSGEPSKMYDDSDDLSYTWGSDENGTRQNVTYEQLPQVLVDAVISAEDSRYFAHDGFDLPRIAKTMITNLMVLDIKGGGSTITQQAIKKAYYPNEERTYTRKIGEVFLAIQATKEVSKEEILELYLNKIYFGRSNSSIGIGAACQYYFNKDVTQITLPEAALLAGTLNAPGRYDPYYNLEAATIRRSTVLDLMLDHGYITEKEKEAAEAIPVENMLSHPDSANSSAMQAYVDLVTQEVIEYTGYDPRVVQMNIHTYLNRDLQQYCDDIVKGVTYDYPDKYMDMGASIQSSLDGRIVAVMGGRYYTAEGINNANYRQSQGSSLKPIVAYGAAIEYLNWCSEHTVEDKAFNIYSGLDPQNWDGGKHGKMVISDALLNSWNLPALWTLHEVIQKTGREEIIDMLERFGINMEGERDNFGEFFTIGGVQQGITPIELAGAYSAIANNGTYIKSHTIDYIEIVSTGEIIKIDEEMQANKVQAISEETAFIVRQIMLKYTSSGSGLYGYLGGLRNVCAKTGTSTWGKGHKLIQEGTARDIWITAFDPDYCLSLWMGRTVEGTKKGYSMQAYTELALPVGARIMKYISSQKETTRSFPGQPSGVTQAKIVAGIYPYVSPDNSIPKDKILTAWFKKGTTPSKSIDSLGINSLASFDASLSDNGIHVSFAEYDPVKATTDEKATEATQIYGKVVYCVDVSKDGKVLYSQKFNTNKGLVNYHPTGKVDVIGYYSYENSSKITSNKITKSVGEDAVFNDYVTYSATANGQPITNGASINASSVKIAVALQTAESVCRIDIKDSSGRVWDSKQGANCTISGLTPGEIYTIVITETNGKKTATSSLTFTVASQESEVDPTENN